MATGRKAELDPVQTASFPLGFVRPGQDYDLGWRAQPLSLSLPGREGDSSYPCDMVDSRRLAVTCALCLQQNADFTPFLAVLA